METKNLTPIKLETLPNGYSLDVNGRGYMYFHLVDLLRGFITHVGLGEQEFMTNKEIEKIIEASLAWKDNGKLVKELAKCKTTIERLEGNNRQLKKKLSKYEDDLDDLD